METHNNFLAWAFERGVELYGVEPREIPRRGIGMVATEKLEEDVLILQVPTTLLRTFNTVPKQAIRRKLPTDISVHGLLAADLALDTSDLYTEWNAVCPSKSDMEASVPLAWPRILQSYLPSPAAGILRKQQVKFTRDWDMVRAAFPDLNEAEYRHAWLLVNTRTFYYSTPETEKMARDDRLALQPVADLFNHADQGCVVNFDSETFTIRTDRVYEEGEEVFISYGHHSNDFLLAEYGFILGENKWDEVALDDMILPELSDAQKEELDGYGFLGKYRLDAEQVCYRSQTALRLLCIDVEAWRRVVEGVDDEDDTREVVDRVLLKLLKTYDRLVVKRISELEGLTEDGEVATAQKQMLVKRWRQVRSLIRKTIERLEAGLIHI